MALVTADDLAGTYAPSYGSGAQARAAYEEFQQYASMHPNAGRGRVAQKLGVPEGRVRAWMDGSKPDCVRGIEIGEEAGWLPLTTDADCWASINRLNAWLCARGSINTPEYQPGIAIRTDDERDGLTGLFDALGVGYTIQHAETDERSTEVRAGPMGTVLGRILTLLDAPLDPECSALQTPPGYLASVDRGHVREWAATYLDVRGIHWEWDDCWTIEHRHRQSRYHTLLARVFERATDLELTVEAHDDSIRVPEAIATELRSKR